MIGPISFEAKQTGERSTGKPSAAFDAAGAGNVARSRCCDTRRRKSESTGNTNFDLNRRASLRPYLREAGGAIPPAYSPLIPVDFLFGKNHPDRPRRCRSQSDLFTGQRWTATLLARARGMNKGTRDA